MVITGIIVLIIPIDNPPMMTVAGPVSACSAMKRVGLYLSEVKNSVAKPMIKPAAKPVITDPQILVYSVPRTILMTKKDTMAIKMALIKIPVLSARSRTPCSAFSPARTKKVPMMDATTPTAAISSGTVRLSTLKPRSPKAAVPRAIVATIEPT